MFIVFLLFLSFLGGGGGGEYGHSKKWRSGCQPGLCTSIPSVQIVYIILHFGS